MTPSGDRPRPRIVIMPGNDALSDARVLKNLATVSRFGMDAIAVGVVRGGPGREVQIGEARVVVARLVTLGRAREQPEAHDQRHRSELGGVGRSGGADGGAAKWASALLDADVTMTAMTDEHGASLSKLPSRRIRN